MSRPRTSATWRTSKRRDFLNKRKSQSASFGATWTMFSLMYLMTSDTVEPFGKLEFFWRFLAGPLNFLPI